MSRPEPLLLLSIDVEEDMPGWNITDPVRVENVQALRELGQTCRELEVRPTYLCTYPVVKQEESRRVLADLVQQGDCEIGTHVHPWNTPPFEGVPGREGDERQHAYYQYELGPERFRHKLELLHTEITQLTGGCSPVSYRAGRFGIDAATLGELVAMGYQVDSSVTPLEEHLDDGGPDFRSAPQVPYRPSRSDVSARGDQEILEIPVSVALTPRLPRLFTRAYVHLPTVTRLRGLLSRDFLRLVDFSWLYPARFDEELMRGAARTLLADGNPVLNVFLHSSELIGGASGRIHTEDDAREVRRRLYAFLRWAREELNARPATLGEAARELRPAFDLPVAPA